jgi:hypothetical protein
VHLLFFRLLFSWGDITSASKLSFLLELYHEEAAVLRDVEPSEVRAARAMLFALRGTINETGLTVSSEYFLQPQANALGEDEAARVIAALPKPLACNATAARGRLEVRCRQLTHAERELHEYLWANSTPQWLEVLGKYGARDDLSRIRVKRDHASLVLTLAELVVWYPDYDFQSIGLSQTAGTARWRDRRGGARVVIRLYPGDRDTSTAFTGGRVFFMMRAIGREPA